MFTVCQALSFSGLSHLNLLAFLFILILQNKNIGTRKIKELAQGHTASNWPDQDLDKMRRLLRSHL